MVRTEAARLRARLNEYYIKEGKADALVIELPKGGYVPLFREVDEGAPGNRAHPGRYAGAAWHPVLGRARACRPRDWAGGRRVVVDSTPRARRLRLRFCRWRTPATIPPTTTLPTALPMS